jgi:hypothetical protein
MTRPVLPPGTSSAYERLSAVDRFEGDFDLLPVAAHLRYGAVPEYPRSEDFQSFAGTKEHEQRPEAHWHLEAIRWRLRHPGKPLSEGLREIAKATASALYKTRQEDWRSP